MDQESQPRDRVQRVCGCKRSRAARPVGCSEPPASGQPGLPDSLPRKAGRRPLLCGGRGFTGLGGAQNGAWDGSPPMSSFLGFISKSCDSFLFTVTEWRACAPSVANHDVQLRGKCYQSLKMAET